MRTYIYSYSSVVIGVAIVLFLEHIVFQPYLFLCGTVISGLGIWLFRQQVAFLSKSRIAYGKLAGWEERPGSKRGVDYYAKVTFDAVDGSGHQVTSATGVWPKPKTPIGHIYPVRYNPENPDEARLDTWFDYWGPSVIIFLFGGIVLFAAFDAKHWR